MEKYIYNEQNRLWYELQGDYYLPCLKLPEEPEVHIGIWGAAAPALSERASTGNLCDVAHQRQAEQLSC